jgi:hypothetical protein
MNIQSVVTELSEKYGFQAETIEKSAMSFIERRFINQLPAVSIDETFVFKGQEVAPDDLESMVLREMCRTEHLP